MCNEANVNSRAMPALLFLLPMNWKPLRQYPVDLPDEAMIHNLFSKTWDASRGIYLELEHANGGAETLLEPLRPSRRSQRFSELSSPISPHRGYRKRIFTSYETVVS